MFSGRGRRLATSILPGRRDSGREQSDGGSEQTSVDTLAVTRWDQCEPEQGRQHDHSYLRGIHVAADSAQRLLGGKVGGDVHGRPNQRPFWVSSDRLALLTREVRVSQQCQLKRKHVFAQTRQFGQGVGQIHLDGVVAGARADATPVR